MNKQLTRRNFLNTTNASDPNYLDEFLKMSDELNLTGCMLTPFEPIDAAAAIYAMTGPKSLLAFPGVAEQAAVAARRSRIVDIHTHFIAKRLPKLPKSIPDRLFHLVRWIWMRQTWRNRWKSCTRSAVGDWANWNL